MASQNPSPALGKLDFLEIKTSLINYLKTQNLIKDYNYEGSVIRTLIDLLAYNTFYYAYYSNMIASEMFLDSAQRLESIISLVKPLGYTVTGKKSSRTTIYLTGLLNVPNNLIPKHSIFYGVNNDGLTYVFRSLEDVDIVDSQCQIEIVEAKDFVYDTSAIQAVDIATQRYFIPNKDIDLSTLKVEVKLNGETDYYTWRLSSNIGAASDVDQKIYFVERTVNGFVIQFGIQNSLGISLTQNDFLRISYAVSSGVDSNGIFVFRSAVNYGTGAFNLSIIQPSAGGLNEPDINSIKFLAPKWFASQDRAVTKNDYIALIMEAGYANNNQDFAVYGGEEIYPAKYGRVFISLNETNQTIIDNMIDYLRTKSVITIFPEYVKPEEINLFMRYAFRYDNPSASSLERQEILNNVKSYVQSNYIMTNKFNVNIDSKIIADDVSQTYAKSNVTLKSEDFTFFVQKNVQPEYGEIILNLQNELDVSIVDELKLTTPFIDKENRNVVLVLKTNYSTDRNRFVDIVGKDPSTNVNLVGYFGKVQIKTGVIQIPPIAQTSYQLNIPLLKTYFSSNNNNLVSVYQTGVEII